MCGGEVLCEGWVCGRYCVKGVCVEEVLCEVCMWGGEVLCEGCVWAGGRYCVKGVCGPGGGIV